mmetsp:Transcript_105906/g.252666  ORF Transcript_105906/g.252666 Transcript_105906/m.252666 type:complete len:377 (-) Transcript_105906:78-1208(-)
MPAVITRETHHVANSPGNAQTVGKLGHHAFGAVDGRMQGGIKLIEVPDVTEDHLLILGTCGLTLAHIDARQPLVVAIKGFLGVNQDALLDIRHAGLHDLCNAPRPGEDLEVGTCYDQMREVREGAVEMPHHGIKLVHLAERRLVMVVILRLAACTRRVQLPRPRVPPLGIPLPEIVRVLWRSAKVVADAGVLIHREGADPIRLGSTHGPLQEPFFQLLQRSSAGSQGGCDVCVVLLAKGIRKDGGNQVQEQVRPVVRDHTHCRDVTPFQNRGHGTTSAAHSCLAAQWDDGLAHDIICSGSEGIEARHDLVFHQLPPETHQREHRDAAISQLLHLRLPNVFVSQLQRVALGLKSASARCAVRPRRLLCSTSRTPKEA